MKVVEVNALLSTVNPNMNIKMCFYKNGIKNKELKGKIEIFCKIEKDLADKIIGWIDLEYEEKTMYLVLNIYIYISFE